MIIPYMKWKIKAMFETTSYNDIMENDGEFFGNGNQRNGEFTGENDGNMYQEFMGLEYQRIKDLFRVN